MLVDFGLVRFLTKVAEKSPRGLRLVLFKEKNTGNEKMVFNTINKLFALGAEVVYESYNQLHVSGHASQEELKLMINLTKPKYFVPIHGENRHLIHHKDLAEKLNINKENIFVLNNGDILEINKINAKVVGKVPADRILVDRKGNFYLKENILNERKAISEDGIIIVTVNIINNQVLDKPSIVSKGFVDENLSSKISISIKEKIENYLTQKANKDSNIQDDISGIIKDYIISYTGRKPVISSSVNILSI